MTKIGVIGAGPAGIVAAGTAALNKSNEVYLLEKNDRIGKKLFITGKGRCNITNALPIDEFFDYVTGSPYFMYSSFYTFNNEDILNLLHGYGLKTKVERGGRVFPESNKSSDVIKAFNKYLNDRKVNIKLNTEVENIVYDGKSFSVYTNNGNYEFDKLLLSTGGVSYKATGSTGDGHNFAKRFGHTVTDLRPSLVPIKLKNTWLKETQGLSLKNVKLSSYKENGKKIHEEFGEMLFSHFGITGPIVLSMSNYIRDYDVDKVNLELDFKPALDEETLDRRIIRDFEKYSNKQFKNSLFDLLPRKIIPIIIKNTGIDEELEVHQITKEQRQILLNNIKRFKLDFDGFRDINEAIVTSGGINVDEVDPSTMESKIIPNLYFAGELLDVDALTGGFNLQVAYSTGFVAGNNM